MYKSIALFFVINFSFTSIYAQIEVLDSFSEIEIGKVMHQNRGMILNITKVTKGEESNYKIMYKNFKARYGEETVSLYQDVELILHNEETLTDLRDLIFDALENSKEKKEVSFKMEDEIGGIIVDPDYLGDATVRFFIIGKGYSDRLDKNQWKKAFEKL